MAYRDPCASTPTVVRRSLGFPVSNAQPEQLDHGQIVWVGVRSYTEHWEDVET